MGTKTPGCLQGDRVRRAPCPPTPAGGADGPGTPDGREAGHGFPEMPPPVRHPLSGHRTPAGEPLQILVVDDEPLIRRMVATALERAGHRVTEAADGREAWDRFQEQPFQMVVTDIRMPGLNGLELLDRVRSANPATEVVMITGFGDVDVVIQALRSGAANFVEKPFTAEEFVEQIGPTLCRCSLRAETSRLEEELKTERKRREQGHRLATLGRLLAGLAHEVHKPLTFVKGNIELLQRLSKSSRTPGHPPEVGDMEGLLDDLSYGVRRIEELMDTMQRLGTDRTAIRAPVSLRSLLENAVRLAAARKPSRASLHTDLPAETVLVKVNAVEMESCFVNLLVNAYEAVEPDGGKVEILVSLYPYETGGIAGFAEVSVRDDGPGIPVELAEEVFSPFFTRKDEHTGLGLTIAYESAKRNDAQVLIENSGNRGGHVLVRLPYTVAEGKKT